jgi:hypothetical protein
MLDLRPHHFNSRGETKDSVATFVADRPLGLRDGPVLFMAVKEKRAADQSLQEYGAALRARDFRRAYEFTDKDFQSVTAFEAFEKQHRGLEAEFGPLQDYFFAAGFALGGKSPFRRRYIAAIP